MPHQSNFVFQFYFVLTNYNSAYIKRIFLERYNKKKIRIKTRENGKWFSSFFIRLTAEKCDILCEIERFFDTISINIYLHNHEMLWPLTNVHMCLAFLVLHNISPKIHTTKNAETLVALLMWYFSPIVSKIVDIFSIYVLVYKDL